MRKINKIKIGVMPAAGFGRRISNLPLTKILPKPLLPILNKPIMEYGIDNMKQLGVETVYIIVSDVTKLIRKYFGDGSDFGVNIKYVTQPIQKNFGLADAIGLTANYITEPFCIILGDDLTLAKSLDNLLIDFWSKDAKILEGVVIEKDKEKIKQSCSVNLDSTGKIINIEEKPNNTYSEIRGCGIYICHPIVYSFINKTPISQKCGEREFTTTLQLIANENLAYGSFINGKNININRLCDLTEAIKLMFL